jgi:hypothetical protein
MEFQLDTVIGERETYLTSTAYSKKNYSPWYEKSFMIPHETLRRELLRAEKALQCIDVVKYPWHAVNFQKWFNNYLVPSIHAHHDAEEEIVGPFYKKLGEEIEFGAQYTHVDLINDMQILDALAVKLLDTVNAGKDNETIAITNEFRTKFNSWHQHMLYHLEEEEKFWPDVLIRHGELKCNEFIQQIINTEVNKKGKAGLAFKVLTGAILDNAGYEIEKFPPSLPTALQLAPWMSERQINEFVAQVPLVPRLVIFPGKHFPQL